jgi:hypothetical protein
MGDAPIRLSGCSAPPLWHVDAVQGGGVHPIAIEHTVVFPRLALAAWHRAAAIPACAESQPDDAAPSGVQLASCRPIVPTDGLNTPQRTIKAIARAAKATPVALLFRDDDPLLRRTR